MKNKSNNNNNKTAEGNKRTSFLATEEVLSLHIYYMIWQSQKYSLNKKINHCKKIIKLFLVLEIIQYLK